VELGLKDKRALVLGGTSGIGLAIAKELRAEGAHIIVASRDLNRVKAIASEVAGEGISLDLTNEASIRAGLDKVITNGGADIIITNSGGPAAGNPTELSLEDWDRGYMSLLRSLILTTQMLVPGMRHRGWGRILNITSTSAREIIPKLPISSTFRAGLTAWTKEMAKELGRSGILINNLLPGPTNTGRLKELEKKSPVFYRSMSEESALGRIAEPDEIGRVAAFLCSNANTFITGTDILVDGGYTKAL